ncbi:disintegrin and metalloproteinase domain-containing protein 21-like isoform X2 [Phacochoerus africanus]|uniref:disintegrin and metalloproteinase domain-containing protein 21-like isoform X2 n=1 Tax=Phacochoerus africanus TaxID=41426 RepID=UPI001FD95B96|nr:disintegrin and metalloproteinase domain-containing protein 21-like isoform X2 [Phacochoerus africanus]XP_047651690.1 disintegrin and metalloproteinase domain-containing protein 21-like isoform X2 [Phacochoerus africanus]
MSLSRDTNPAEGQVTLKEALWLLGFWAVLASVQCSQGRPSWRYISSEVVIPRKELHHGKGVQMPGWLSYSLHFGGQRHIIHMRPKKIFWPGHLLVMTQDDQGALQMDYPFIPSDCYHLGYLEEIPFSRVTVDTCYGGLRGFMKLDDLTYEINPMRESQRFEHVVSQIVADANAVGPMYTLGSKEEEDALFSLEDASAAPRIANTFSNCSFVHIQHVYFYSGKKCMFQTASVYHNRSLANDRCGDKKVDPGETCDCGSIKECYSNPCCTDECRLTPGSSCSVDLCCSNCNYSRPGTLCRPTQNICDLPEYCTGTERFCPGDVYLQDGTPCSEEGYCYHGNCTDRSMHCKEIFGRNAVNAANECYSINKRGHRYGHCRKRPEAVDFTACSDADVLCGRLQCTNVTHLPVLQEHVGFHQSVISSELCFGVDVHRGTETNDVGHVRTGTLCRPRVFCSNTYCNGTLTDLRYDCIPEKCSYRGICNNRRNCHCHIGWDPPYCVQEGVGGSVDSGPPQERKRSLKQTRAPIIYLRLLFGRLYAFIAAMLFGVATNIKSIKTTTVKEVTVNA